MNEPKQIVSAQNRLGETPIWEPEENALYWVDWGGLPTCRFEPGTGKFETFPATRPVTALARRASRCRHPAFRPQLGSVRSRSSRSAIAA